MDHTSRRLPACRLGRGRNSVEFTYICTVIADLLWHDQGRNSEEAIARMVSEAEAMRAQDDAFRRQTHTSARARTHTH